MEHAKSAFGPGWRVVLGHVLPTAGRGKIAERVKSSPGDRTDRGGRPPVLVARLTLAEAVDQSKRFDTQPCERTKPSKKQDLW